MAPDREYLVDPDCLYHREHTWVRMDGGEAVVGLTDFAQREMGAISMADLPEEGDEVDEGKPFGTLESGKWVQKLVAPVGGEIVEVNRPAAVSSSIVNRDPYGKGWLVRIGVRDPSAIAGLMKPEEYRAFCVKE